MPTAVVSGRVDESIKQRADVAMRNAGLSPTDVIQNVWATMARTGDVPDAARPIRSEDGGRATALARLKHFVESLPPVNPAYADLSDDEILALKVRDHV